MCRGMKKPCGIKVRCYVTRLNNLNMYLALFPGATLSDKIGVTELNKNMLNSMPNIWSMQAYVQGFDCESILFKILLACFSKWILMNLFMKV